MDTFRRVVAVMGTVGRLPSTPAWGFGHGEGLQRIAVGKPAIALEHLAATVARGVGHPDG